MSDDDKEPIHIEVANITRLTKTNVLALSPDLADAIGALVLEATAECAAEETLH